jgi:hypothetical protein
MCIYGRHPLGSVDKENSYITLLHMAARHKDTELFGL